MNLDRRAKLVTRLLIGFLACSAIGLSVWVVAGRNSPPERPYRIGWEIDPPEQYRGDDGQPTGFAVELVREAARRRGIPIEWVYRQESSEAALRGGYVDLWPVMTITPERTRLVHISSPFLESTLCLLVRASSPARRLSDLSEDRIAYSGLPINYVFLHRYLPRAQFVARPYDELIKSLCQKEVEAAFLEEHVAISEMLAGRGCPEQPMRIIPTSGPRLQLGVGSTFKAAAAADAIREEIGRMATDGLLPALLARWGFLSGRSEESIEALLSARQRERWLISLVGLFALLLVLAAWEARRATREGRRARRSELELRESQRQLQTELAERMRSEKEIETLSARLIGAQEEERKRLAGELHDDLNQQIAVASIAVANLKRHLPPEQVDARRESDRVHQKLAHLAEMVRRMSHSLHPAVLQYFGLPAAIRSCSEEFADFTHIGISVKTSGSFDDVPYLTAISVYRIAQEALQNIAKHANASTGLVELSRSDGVLCLTVSDSGVGMESVGAAMQNGIGLLSIKERARLVGGSVEITSQSNHGTSVTVKVPL